MNKSLLQFIFAASLIYSQESLAEKFNISLGFEKELYSESNLSLGYSIEPHKSFGLRTGISGYPRRTVAGKVKRQNVTDLAIFYDTKFPVTKDLLAFRMGFEVGTSKYPEGSARSSHNHFQSSWGFGFLQGSIEFYTDIAWKWNAIRGDEIVLIGDKEVESLSVFPRMGFVGSF